MERRTSKSWAARPSREEPDEELSAALRGDELRSLFTSAGLGSLERSRVVLAYLNEWPSTLLAHAELARAGRAPDPVADATDLARIVEALVKHDPDYPRLLALGIVEHWKGRYDAAEAMLAAHLDAHRTGPWRLRAQGYLLAARRRIPSAEAK